MQIPDRDRLREPAQAYLARRAKKTATSQGWPLLFVGQKSAVEEVDTGLGVYLAFGVTITARTRSNQHRHLHALGDSQRRGNRQKHRRLG